MTSSHLEFQKNHRKVVIRRSNSQRNRPRTAATATATTPPPTRVDKAELAGVEPFGGTGTLAAATVPFKALATFWYAVKFLSLLSTALMAKTIPVPQWLEGTS